MGKNVFGGCDTDGYLYVVDGCAAATSASESARCQYWTDEENNTYPISQCLYGGDGDNCDNDAQSCEFTCSSTGQLVLNYYNDTYGCDTIIRDTYNISSNQWTCADDGASSGSC